MRRILGILGLLALGWGPPAAAQAPFRVFMIASKAADHAESIQASRPVVEGMAKANGFEVDFTTDTGLINDANLAKYQVFLQMQLAPFEMSLKQRSSFQKFIEQGKGWVGIHAAGLTGDQFNSAQPTWQFYQDFFGGVTYVTHAVKQMGNFNFEDRNHPATRNMPATLRINDEWYEWNRNPRPNVRVLAVADETTYTPVKRQGDHPIIWSSLSFPKSMYIGVGHFPEDWANPTYAMLIRDALLWARPAATAADPGAAAKGYLGATAGNRLRFKNGVLFLDSDAPEAGIPAPRLWDTLGRLPAQKPAGASTSGHSALKPN